jgi:hypothetical protein
MAKESSGIDCPPSSHLVAGCNLADPGGPPELVVGGRTAPPGPSSERRRGLPGPPLCACRGLNQINRHWSDPARATAGRRRPPPSGSSGGRALRGHGQPPWDAEMTLPRQPRRCLRPRQGHERLTPGVRWKGAEPRGRREHPCGHLEAEQGHLFFLKQ